MKMPKISIRYDQGNNWQFTWIKRYDGKKAMSIF